MDILDTEANEFVTEGESVKLLTGQSLASELVGDYAIPMQHAHVPSQEPYPAKSKSSLRNTLWEKELFGKIERKDKSAFRDFEALADQIINTKVDLKTDSWDRRTGPLFKIEIFVAVINLYK